MLLRLKCVNSACKFSFCGWKRMPSSHFSDQFASFDEHIEKDQKRHGSRPRTDACGTPLRTSTQLESDPLTLTLVYFGRSERL